MCENFSENDYRWMRRALALARRGLGQASPNPCVGAVLVRDGELLGQGFHRRAGEAHAEVEALRDAQRKGKKVWGATLYVTLEPCCTYGRTPPCTDAIVEAGIERVVVGCQDPNPRHQGRGLAILREAGIRVDCGLLCEENAWLNRGFFRWIQEKRPWVIAKLALSLDGKIATWTGDSRWLTGIRARRWAHRLRAECDAILIGAETARKDNPSLTVRWVPEAKARCPLRVVVTRSGRLSPKLKLFKDPYKEKTMVFQGYPLREVLQELGSRGITRLLVEGGAALVQSAFREGLVDEVAFFLAPVVVGTEREGGVGVKSDPIWLKDARFLKLGEDVFCTGVLSPIPMPIDPVEP